MVLLDLSSARRKQREDPVTARVGWLARIAWAVDVAGDSGGTTTPNSLVVALGIFRSGNRFNTPSSKEACKTSIGLGSDSSSHLRS